jgi:hypothetical protein
MKMVPVYNANGDKILACEPDLAYYQSIGWKPEQPKSKPAKETK